MDGGHNTAHSKQHQHWYLQGKGLKGLPGQVYMTGATRVGRHPLSSDILAQSREAGAQDSRCHTSPTLDKYSTIELHYPALQVSSLCSTGREGNSFLFCTHPPLEETAAEVGRRNTTWLMSHSE